MDANDRLKLTIGELVMAQCGLAAELDKARETIASLTQPSQAAAPVADETSESRVS